MFFLLDVEQEPNRGGSLPGRISYSPLDRKNARGSPSVG
jgi:hypothetical protein